LTQNTNGQNGQANAATENQPAVSVGVEGGFGLEGKAKVGPVEVKLGGTVQGEVEVSPNGTKVSAKGEVGGNVGPVKLPGGQIEKVTKNESGNSEPLTLSWTKPGVSGGKSETTGWKDEITISISGYAGPGGGVSVTIRPVELFNAGVNWLKTKPSPPVDFNTNQHGIGAWQ
jgi:hypothetical protein